MIGLAELFEVITEVDAINNEQRAINPNITLDALARAGLPSNVESDAADAICQRSLVFAHAYLTGMFGEQWDAETVALYGALMWWSAFVLGVRARDPEEGGG